MIQCQKCGQSNSEQSQFCRFCGTKFPVPQSYLENDYDYQAPRPYAWKTDEYQTQSEPRKNKQINQVEPLNTPQAVGSRTFNAQPLAYHGPNYLAQNYRCPKCGTHTLPITERRISTAGWIVFSLLLVFTFIFFWVGLLMKENVSVCPVCRAKVS